MCHDPIKLRKHPAGSLQAPPPPSLTCDVLISFMNTLSSYTGVTKPPADLNGAATTNNMQWVLHTMSIQILQYLICQLQEWSGNNENKSSNVYTLVCKGLSTQKPFTFTKMKTWIISFTGHSQDICQQTIRAVMVFWAWMVLCIELDELVGTLHAIKLLLTSDSCAALVGH